MVSDAFEALLATCRPRRLLVCGERAGEIGRQWAAGQPGTELTSIDQENPGDDPALLQPHDLALISDTVENLPREKASLFLGQLRNLGTQQIAVLAKDDGSLVFRDYIGLGFVRQAHFETEPPETLYTYNIASYNRKRDWNNPRFWANPEMWNKSRW
ncbi:DUF6231 family protein [Marinobacter sp.]|uniref:DUF6231 family protein n=1 Tax=Marinobacter sp. TaxID=50741 RepID=UPI00384CB7AA